MKKSLKKFYTVTINKPIIFLVILTLSLIIIILIMYSLYEDKNFESLEFSLNIIILIYFNI